MTSLSSESDDGPSAEARRARLLAATVDVAGERGWEGTTLREIVKRAGLSKRAVYDHFDDKQQCFLAAASELMQRVSGVTLEACRTAGGRGEGLAAGIDGLLRFCGDDPHAARVYLLEAPAAGPAGAELWRAHMREMSQQADSALRDLRADLPPHASAMAIGGVYTAAQARVVAGEASQLPELAPAMIDAVWATLGIGQR
jgi:AcrR family transcriptional regulator